MKKLLGFTIFVTIAMLLIPLWALKEPKSVSAVAPVASVMDKTEAVQSRETFKVLKDGEIAEFQRSDYIFGVVAAEMPALYHEEALKAQAVAAYTFATVKAAQNSALEYDITSDHTIDQSFITEAEAREKWGDNADEYIAKIKKAVAETEGELICYKGEPITAFYHAISGGKTEDSKNVWGKELPYLKSKLSTGDTLAKNYLTEVTFTAEQLADKLSGEVKLSGEPQNYFGNSKRTEAGTVREINLCGEKLSGFKLQSLLSLRSANFEVKYQEDKFVFTVKGAGHGVGMSQNGANFMANQGSGYKEILTYYYDGCEIVK